MIKQFIKRWKNYTYLKNHPTYSEYMRNINRLRYVLFYRPLTDNNACYKMKLHDWKPMYKQPIMK